MTNEAIGVAAVLVFSYYLPSFLARLSAPLSREEHFPSKALMYGVYGFFYAAFGYSLYSQSAASLILFGLVLSIAGILLHYYAIKALGRAYSAGTQFKPGQKIIASDVYSLCRHPLYSAAILFFAGLSLFAIAPITLTAFALVLAYTAYRIRVEEALLRKRFGRAYAEYARRVPATIFGWALKKIQ